MANQKAMNNERFEGIMWRNERNVFKATKDVQRKPFGDFTVTFAMNANTGETEMRVRNWIFEELNSEPTTYKTFKQAVNAATEYFGQIDELVKKVSKNAKRRADMAYRRELVKEVVNIRRMND